MFDILKTAGGARFRLCLCFLPVCFFLGHSRSEGFCAGGLCRLAAVQSCNQPAGEPSIDKTKYISVDEIQPGSDAYCLTVLEGSKVEKFNLRVLSVVRNIRPGRDAIIVVGTDERFKHLGPIRGCSGSPVYIDSRLAGALAGSWVYAKDPFYQVTPIKDMLEVGPGPSYEYQSSDRPISLAFDFSKPIDLTDVSRRLTAGYTDSKLGTQDLELLVTSLPAEVCNEIAPRFAPLGLMPVAGGSGGSEAKTEDSSLTLEAGACLAIPLVSGDISMSVVGTATEVVGEKVFAFGHGFLGYGQVDLPMAAGEVHSVISNMAASFKLATAGPITGAIRADKSTGIYGEIGAEPKLIPMRITVARFDEAQEKTYNCKLAVNRLYTPLVTEATLAGAVSVGGSFGPEHMVKYKAGIGVEGFGLISFENVSSGRTLRELANEAVGTVALVMSNPYRRVDISELNFDVQILPKNILSEIWSVKLSDTKVKPGQTIDVSVVLLTYLSEKKIHRFQFKIPDDLASGQYGLLIAGGYDYEKFLRKVSPHKFTTEDLPTLIEGLKNILTIRRDRLYLTMMLGPGGIVIRHAELIDLPKTKAMLLGDTKRTIKGVPLQQWLEKDIYVGNIVLGGQALKISVEK